MQEYAHGPNGGRISTIFMIKFHTYYDMKVIFTSLMLIFSFQFISIFSSCTRTFYES